jgi:transposase
MKLLISKSKNAASLYVQKHYYDKERRVRTSKIVEKLGTLAELEKRLGGEDPIRWAEAYVAELNRNEQEESQDVMVKFSPRKQIAKGEKRSFNGGYLFLQKIYHELGLNTLCKETTKKHKFTFNLDSILSRLLYSRILFPASKLETSKLAANFLEKPDFDLQHVYRSLEVLSKENDFIQSTLYNNSLNISKRNTGVLYYDCTNFFFEIEQADGIKQYGVSKEHRPNPIVQMGLFMDGDGIPLAFSINKGNTNEQLTLTPLEQKILDDFKLSKFVVCTDAGLASTDNRKFNDKGQRAFITTQSIKQLKKLLKNWALSPDGWKLASESGTFNINMLDERKYQDKIFYKERWINENDLEQKLIVTYSIKYRDYQKSIRDSQVERAQKLIDSKSIKKLDKVNTNDYRRFIDKKHLTSYGEIADVNTYSIDNDVIEQEAQYDGFYAVCTNLDDDVTTIISVNSRRWEIEECFRIMKSEFRARPVYLSREDRITAHFITCFLSLVLLRYVEKRLGGKYTYHEIITALADMNFHEIKGDGYAPSYTRTNLTDDLHEAFGFRTDYEIVTYKQMKNIFKASKS